MLEIVAGVIGKKIVEQAGLCYFRTATVNQRAARAGLDLVFSMDNRVGRRQFS